MTDVPKGEEGWEPVERYRDIVVFKNTDPHNVREWATGKTLYHGYTDLDGRLAPVRCNRESLKELHAAVDEYHALPNIVVVQHQGKKRILQDPEREGIPVDTEIVELVVGLNDAGLETVSSCSGHQKKKGFVAFANRLGREECICARDIANRLGFRNIQFETVRTDAPEPQSRMSFTLP